MGEFILNDDTYENNNNTFFYIILEYDRPNLDRFPEAQISGLSDKK